MILVFMIGSRALVGSNGGFSLGRAAFDVHGGPVLGARVGVDPVVALGDQANDGVAGGAADGVGHRALRIAVAGVALVQVVHPRVGQRLVEAVVGEVLVLVGAARRDPHEA